MSPIRTRAQNRRKSGVSPPPFPPASTRKTQRPPMASAMRPSNVKKIARRRKSFKIEVLADRTSSLNVAEQKKLRRKTSFHPETVSLIKATPSPLDEIKKAPQASAQVDEKRRRRASRTPRPSLHVHWAENLRRVVSISPSQSTSALQRGQGEQACGQPRSILRVFHDSSSAAPLPSDISLSGTLTGSSNALGLYALSEVPRGITLRRPLREPRASLHPHASGSRTLSVDDSLSDLSALSDESFATDMEQAPCTTLRVPVKSTPAEISPSGPGATRVMGATSSTTQERAIVGGPPALRDPPIPTRLTETKARRVINPTNDRAPAPAPALLPTDIPTVVPQHRWLNLPENRVDRWIMIFYMVYVPIILPLLLRVLGMV